MANSSKVASQREQDLAAALRQLLDALDKQHWQATPPGKYHYSPRVDVAIYAARRLFPEPPEILPEPPAEDVGGPSDE